MPRIKGNHNAMLSGKAAAEAAHAAIKAGRSGDELPDYEKEVREGSIGQDLFKVRNVKSLWSKYGLTASLAIGGFDMWCNTLFGASLLGTMHHGKSDADATELASKHKEIAYPKPDGKLSFDRLTNVDFQVADGKYGSTILPISSGPAMIKFPFGELKSVSAEIMYMISIGTRNKFWYTSL